MIGLPFNNNDKSKTYGEKAYSNIFDLGINLGLNIVASAVFTYWVRHSTRPVMKNAGKGKMSELLNRSPADMYEKLVLTFQNGSFMGPFKGKRNVAEAMANIFTLNFAGHGVVIPSVWLGDKYHSAIVEHFDKKHYEQNGMEMPDWVKARHQEIRNDDKTSLFGSVVSRMGTLSATTGTAYLIGGRDNMLTLLGKKKNIDALNKFKGIDEYAGKLGAIAGGYLENAMPSGWVKAINKGAQKRGYGHSINQTAEIKSIKEVDIKDNFNWLESLRLKQGGEAGIKNYKGFSQDFSRYHFLDVLYSSVTVLAIPPMKAVAKMLPGATYKQEDQEKKPHKTIGEHVHGLYTYGGIDWLVNAAVGATFAFATKRTQMGQKFFNAPMEKGLNIAFKPLFKSKDQLSKAVSGGGDLVAITVGGTAINPILTSLEKPENKKGFAKTVDTWIHGKETVENDPKFQKAYDAIDKQPEKNMSAAWISRFIALVPILYVSANPKARAFFTENNVPVLKHVTTSKISSYSANLFSKVGLKKPNSGFWAQSQLDKTSGKMESNWRAMHNMIGFDFGLTPYYAAIHAATFPMVAKALDDRGWNDAKKANESQPHIPSQGDDIVVNVKLPKPSTSIREATNVARLQDAPAMQVVPS